MKINSSYRDSNIYLSYLNIIIKRMGTKESLPSKEEKIADIISEGVNKEERHSDWEEETIMKCTERMIRRKAKLEMDIMIMRANNRSEEDEEDKRTEMMVENVRVELKKKDADRKLNSISNDMPEEQNPNSAGVHENPSIKMEMERRENEGFKKGIETAIVSWKGDREKVYEKGYEKGHKEGREYERDREMARGTAGRRTRSAPK